MLSLHKKSTNCKKSFLQACQILNTLLIIIVIELILILVQNWNYARLPGFNKYLSVFLRVFFLNESILSMHIDGRNLFSLTIRIQESQIKVSIHKFVARVQPVVSNNATNQSLNWMPNTTIQNSTTISAGIYY